MFKKFMKKNKDYLKVSVFLLLVLISGFTFYFFVKADDTDQNKFTVSNFKVVKVEDGIPEVYDSTEPIWVDENSYNPTTGENVGNDNSNSNGVVRNFDSIKYNINFDLAPKTGIVDYSASSPRRIALDVIFNGTFDGTISADTSSNVPLVSSSDKNYKYGEIILEAEPNAGITRTITLNTINGNNNDNVEPIFVIREYTDEDTKSISSLTEEERNNINFATDTTLNYIKSDSYCTEGVTCKTVITGAEDYTLNIYNGATSRNDVNSSVTPIGVGVYLNVSAVKGMKGLIIPSTINYTVNLPANTDNVHYNYVAGSIKNYSTLDPSVSDANIYIDSNYEFLLPSLGSGTPSVNEGATCATQNCLGITINNIDKSVIQLVDGEYYLVSNIFNFEIMRSNYTQDLNYELTASYGNKTSNTISSSDKVGKYVGTYESKISFFDSDVLTFDDSNKKTDGYAITNFGQTFTIKEDIQYGVNSGTALEDLTNYIKIDNDAIKIINGNDNLPVKIDGSIMPTITYGFGKWNSTYFELNTDDSTCASYGSINDLTKEEIMNLYGGPCIRETSSFKWSTSATETTTEFEDEDLINYGPLVIKFVYNKENGIAPGFAQSEIVYAKVKNDSSLINTAHQVVSNATANFKNNSNNTVLYYLSNEIDTSAENLIRDKDNFRKTNYDFENKTITLLNSTKMCNGALSCAITGNTILVSAVRVNKPTISTYLDNVSKTEFYYYPIEWRINASAYVSDLSLGFKSATVKVEIPDYLRPINYGGSQETRIYREETSNISGYKTLVYTFTGEEIQTNNGHVPTFSIFTDIELDTKDGLQPEIYVTADFEVTDNVSINASSISIEGNRRATANVIVHNGANIGLKGMVNNPYFERNGDYFYNMKVYNNSIKYNGNEFSTGITYNNPTLYYVLPYNRDSSYTDLSSSFDESRVEFEVSIKDDLTGYKAYYTTGNNSSIISGEMDEALKQYTWVEWTNPKLTKKGITAIKIVKDSDNSTFAPEEYFFSDKGLNIGIKPLNGASGDRFYNSFYFIVDAPSSLSCNTTESTDCYNSSKILNSSSRTLASIYSREISGFVFEDYDYTGLYDNIDEKLSEIPVSVCKISKNLETENYDPENPSTYVSKEDECVGETTTDMDGSFLFRGLNEGNYYVKYTFNSEKYLVAERKVISSNASDSNMINSKATQLPDSNIAISNIITFDESNLKANYVNLGLRVKKQFNVELKKYITKVTINDYNGVKSLDYNKATKVAIDLKNPKNAHIKVKYLFTIKNVKYFPGYVGIIADKIPKGMKFDQTLTENQNWVLFEDTLYYNGLAGKLLDPNDEHQFELVLDLDVSKGGRYVNIVTAKELVLMGDELPEYDFSQLNAFEENNEGNGE